MGQNCTRIKYLPPQEKEAQMYDLAYVEPRLGGYVYRTSRKCGHPTCKCASSAYKHFFYRLEYRVREKGRWKKKREYVAKNKVKALRQRIRRAKEKDKRRREQIADFMERATELVTSSDFGNTAKLKYLLSLSQQKLEPVTLKRQTQLLKCMVSLIVKLRF